MWILTCKAEKSFKEWMRSKGCKWYPKELSLDLVQAAFQSLITEWFDTVGIYIDPITYLKGKFVTHYSIAINGVEYDVKETTKQAAIAEGIKLANKIYNNHANNKQPRRCRKKAECSPIIN